MVVVGIEPTFRFMDRSGIATGTRTVATKLWNGRLPRGSPAALARKLYAIENKGKRDPSGSQDMIGLIYPGINRLDYDFNANSGVFPCHVEPLPDLRSAHWLERVLQLLPIAPRPEHYHPLGEQRLAPRWIARLGESGRACFEAIRGRDIRALGASLNECMRCWESLLPHTVRHPALTVDLASLLRVYQDRYPGAMYSGCGGGYLFVVSDEPVQGALKVTLRIGVK
jgi:hypothetical protein